MTNLTELAKLITYGRENFQRVTLDVGPNLTSSPEETARRFPDTFVIGIDPLEVKPHQELPNCRRIKASFLTPDPDHKVPPVHRVQTFAPVPELAKRIITRAAELVGPQEGDVHAALAPQPDYLRRVSPERIINALAPQVKQDFDIQLRLLSATDLIDELGTASSFFIGEVRDRDAKVIPTISLKSTSVR